jgi:hypothetical protein
MRARATNSITNFKDNLHNPFVWMTSELKNFANILLPEE